MKRLTLLSAAIVLTGSLFLLGSCGAQENTDSAPAAQAQAETPPAIETRLAEATPDKENEPVRDQLSVVTAKDLKAAREASNAPEPDPPASDPSAEDSQAEPTEGPPAEPAAGDAIAALIAAGDTKFRSGRDYTVLTPAQPTSSPPDKVELAEVFMYKCPHCFSFESFIDKWKETKPAGVDFVRVPAMFDNIAKVHATAYYAAEAMQVLDTVHLPFFTEIHVNRKMPTTEDQTADFIASLGIDKDEFLATMKSFAVDTKVRQADTLGRRYRISSVPTLVINGKYVTSGSMAKSEGRLREIIDYLIAKELAQI